MTFVVRFTRGAESDLQRLFEFILERDQTDWTLTERSLLAIKDAIRILEISPFSFRKAAINDPFLRELVIPFGSSGYVALFEIDDERTVSVLAVRHQLDDDYQ